MERLYQGAALMVLALGVGCGGDKGSSYNTDTGSSTEHWRLVHAEAQRTPFSSLPSYGAIPLTLAHPDSRSMFEGGVYATKTQDVSFVYDSSGEVARIEGYYTPPTYTFTTPNSEDRFSLTQEEFLNYSFTDEKLFFVRGETKPFFKQGDLIYSADYDHISASDWSVVTNSFQKTPTPMAPGDSCDGEIWSADFTRRIVQDPAPPRAAFDFAEGFEQFCITPSVTKETQTFVAWDEVYSGERRVPAAPPLRIFNDDELLEEITYYNTAADAPPALQAQFRYNNTNALRFSELEFNRELILETSTDSGTNEVIFYLSTKYEAEYLYPTPGIVIAKLYKVDDNSRALTEEITATYENIACGPMTLEREKSQPALLFPTCVSTHE